MDLPFAKQWESSSFSSLLKRCCLAPSEHDVETIPESPFRFGDRQIELRNQTRLHCAIWYRLQHRVKRNQRIIGKVHLGNQPCDECRSEQRKMNMRRTPRVMV